MKIFESERAFKKLIIILICIILLSFCMPKTVSADSGEIGGKLLNPIMSFFVAMGDGAMSLLQSVVLHADTSLINIDSSAGWLSTLIVAVTAIAIAAVAIAAVVITGGGALAIAIGVAKTVITVGTVAVITFPVTSHVVEGMLPDTFYLPLYSITPQEIFSNKIPLLDVDFFNPSEDIELDDGTTMKSTAAELRGTISNWYTILRDISLVGLLSILVYTGIRILISSTSNDKAKYKQMLVDWIVALCLMFVMQYIMSFSNLLVEKIIDLIDTTKVSAGKTTETTEPEIFIISEKEKVDKAYEVIVGDDGENSKFYSYFTDADGNPAGENATQLVWPAENFMDQARIKLQLLNDDKETYVAIGWKLIYVVLVIFTLIFIFTYLKRVVYMTFLTLIAPLVALTYPLDKMNDGKAQAFNMWFKEYIFNLLIQPMHLILYTILIGSAMDFASENILYVVVALGFMIPAEKLLRSFFGFEKAKTPGLLAGPAGAAIMMSGVNKLLGKGPKPAKSSGVKGSGEKGIADGKNDKIKFKDANLLEDKVSINYNSEDDKANTNYNMDIDEQKRLNGTYNSNNNSSGNNSNNNFRDDSSLNKGLENRERLNDLNNGEKPQYIEDRISNWASDKKYKASQTINDIGDKINNNKVVKGMKNLGSNTVGKPIRAIKRLPQHSRFVNAGVKGIKKSTNTLANKLGNRIKEYNPAKTAWNVAKTGAKVAVGGTAGLVAGSIAGIASGDPSKAFQYATAGVMGGYKLADSVDKKIADDIFSNTGFKEEAAKGYYGDDYDQHLINKRIKEVQNNYDNKQKVLDKFKGDKKSAKEFMNNVVPEYAQYGITEIKDIFAGEELVKGGASRDMAIKVASTVNEYGKNTSKLGAKDSEDLDKTILNRTRKQFNAKSSAELSEKYGKDDSKLSKEQKAEKDKEKAKLAQAQNVANQTRKLMNKYSGIKYKK